MAVFACSTHGKRIASVARPQDGWGENSSIGATGGDPAAARFKVPLSKALNPETADCDPLKYIIPKQ